MSFTYDLSTDVGTVRLHLQDNTLNSGILPDGVNFEDQEIAAVLSACDDDVMSAVATLLEVASRRWALFVDTDMGPLKEKLSQISSGLAKQAASIRATYGIVAPSGTDLVVAAKLLRDDAYAEESDDVGAW